MTNTNEIGDQLRLDLLREALPYIQRFQGQTFVVKLSGKATEDHANLSSLAEELALLHQVGIRICVIHGGGKQLSELAKIMGIEQTIIEGRRVTDEDGGKCAAEDDQRRRRLPQGARRRTFEHLRHEDDGDGRRHTDESGVFEPRRWTLAHSLQLSIMRIEPRPPLTWRL